MHFTTKSIHIGQKPELATGAIISPVYMTSTYAQENPGVYKGYDYTRAGNPNFTMLEQVLAALEEGAHATVFSSGLGALTALASTLKAGDRVVATNDLYGGTFRLFTQVFNRFNIIFSVVDMTDVVALTEAMRQKPAMVIIESPTNPLLKIIDIRAIVTIAKQHGALTVVDNTFASPYFQKPLLLGADVVVHSTTKYIGGHSDVIGGAAITNNADVKKQMDFARKAIGLNPSPFDTWLTLRGVKTLGLRMEQHQKNALAVAKFFATHPRIKKIYYPGLPAHPNHDIARRQMSGFSGIVSAEFNLSLEYVKRVISSFKIFTLAESLGGVESLVDHPASMTHASIPRSEREASGLADGLVRFSVGIEDAEDLVEDLRVGLERVEKVTFAV